MRTFILPDSSIPVSMALMAKGYFSLTANKGGLHSIELESTKINQMINDGTDHKLYGIVINSEGKIFVSCTRKRRLYVENIKQNDVCLLEPFCGSDKPGRTYGLANSVSFVQPTAMAVDGKSVVVIDTATNSVTLVSHLKPLGMFLGNCREIYKALDIHSKSKVKHLFKESVTLLRETNRHLQSVATNVVDRFEISRKELNGSYGSISHETLESLKTLEARMQTFCGQFPEMKCETFSKSLMTEVNEHVNAEARGLAQNEAIWTLSPLPCHILQLSKRQPKESASSHTITLPMNDIIMRNLRIL